MHILEKGFILLHGPLLWRPLYFFYFSVENISLRYRFSNLNWMNSKVQPFWPMQSLKTSIDTFLWALFTWHSVFWMLPPAHGVEKIQKKNPLSLACISAISSIDDFEVNWDAKYQDFHDHILMVFQSSFKRNATLFT